MPIHHPAPTPPFNIIRMSHVELGVTDLDASRKFYTEILGMIETEQVGDSIYLRGLEERVVAIGTVGGQKHDFGHGCILAPVL